MPPTKDDEYLGLGVLSRLANGRVVRVVGMVTIAAMVVPVLFWMVSLY